MTHPSRPGTVGTRQLRLVLAVSFVFASAAVGAGGLGVAANAASSGSSAVTVAGKGEFKDLKVTVSQTENLTNQVVHVTWSGAAPTPATSTFQKNYLQIFQCWGDEADGPDRTQCQFGGFSGDARGGEQPTTSSRVVSYGTGQNDPDEPIKYDGGFYAASVPFKSVTDPDHPIPGSGDDSTRYFDSFTTNEVPYARTSGDGTGEQFFEIQTALDAPGLGCGTPVGSGSNVTGRSCWLVVVPRGDTDINGVQVQGSHSLYTSPLEYTTWKSRIVVPLKFLPIAASCRLNTDERGTVGQEAIQEAISRWQPSLCATTGSVYSYSEINDNLARTQLLTKPELSFISDAVPASDVPEGSKIVYAPIAANAVVVAFNVSSNSSGRAPPEIKKDDGKRIATMKLNALLLAKLLTQSYKYGLAGADAPEVATNTTDLFHDPQFLKLNPNYDKRTLLAVGNIVTTATSSDAITSVWRWIAGDAAARAFIDGKVDGAGDYVNPNYKKMDLGLNRFPRNDLYCTTVAPNQPKLCEFDSRPYAADNHDAARATSRGDTLTRNWDPNAAPPQFKKIPLQTNGAYGMITFTDAATAARYSLPVAALRNTAGKYVLPDRPNLLASVAAMKKTPGVATLEPNPTSKAPTAYPLTTLTYAATVPSKLTKKAAADYKALIDYAVGPGQVPGNLLGQLPDGYAPLPSSLVGEARSAAGQIVSLQAASTAPKPTVKPTPTPTPTTSSASADGGSTPTDTGASTDTAAQPAGAAAPTPVAGPSPKPIEPSVTAIAPVTKTSAVPVGAGRLAFLAALVLGIVAAASGPVLLKLGRRTS